MDFRPALFARSAVLLFAAAVSAQTYPARPITVVSAFAAGGIMRRKQSVGDFQRSPGAAEDLTAACQFRPRKADVPGNLARIGEVLAQAAALSPRPHVVHFPETATSAYFVEGGVRECSLTIAELTAGIAQAYAAASSAAFASAARRFFSNS